MIPFMLTAIHMVLAVWLISKGVLDRKTWALVLLKCAWFPGVLFSTAVAYEFWSTGADPNEYWHSGVLAYLVFPFVVVLIVGTIIEFGLSTDQDHWVALPSRVVSIVYVAVVLGAFVLAFA